MIITILSTLLICALTAFLAKRKGYNPILWFFAGGLLGILVLVFLPFTNKGNLSEEERIKKVKLGNIIGGIITIIAITFSLLIFVSHCSYEQGFIAGRDYTARRDSSEPKKWISKKWKYEITFPWYWEPIKRDDPSVEDGGNIDVFCENLKGYSTAVFAYKKYEDDSIEKLSERILEGLREMIGEIEIIEKKDYEKDGVQYRKILIKTENWIQYYTFVVADEVMLTISSISLEYNFEVARKDFDSIVESIRFF